MGNQTAFFYGTLMAKEVLYRVIYGPGKLSPAHALLSSQLTIQPAILRDFCRYRVQCCDYPGIIPEEGHTVRGTYVTGLTDGDLYRLDCFEGDQYEKVTVTVTISQGDGEKENLKSVLTQTYVWTAGEDELEKKEWDFGEFRKQKMWKWTGNSEEFDEVDEAAGLDPTGGRGVKPEDSNIEELARPTQKALKSAV